MRPQTLSLAGVGTSEWIPVDYRVAPFSLGIQVVTTGTITYTVEVTLDDVFDSTITPTAFALTDFTGQTSSKTGGYSYPVFAVRIKNTVGTGATAITILQGSRT